jgi:hypothetical protein
MLVGWEEGGRVPKYYVVRNADWHSRFVSTSFDHYGGGALRQIAE